MQDETGKKVVLNSKETVEAVKFVAALYKEAMTRDVLSWNDASNNQYIASGVGSLIVNPISAYRTAQQLNKKVADDIFVLKPPKGPVRRLMDGASELLRHLEVRARTRRRRSSSSNTTPTTGSTPSRRAPATTCRSSPTSCRSRCRSCPTIRPRTRTTSWPSCRLRTSGARSPAIPGPAWPATDEIYNNFIICDMMAKAATGAMSAEESVKWADAAMRGHLQEVAQKA